MSKLPKTVITGRMGEQNSRVIYLNVSDEMALFPGTVPSLVYRRPGEDELYPGTIAYDTETNIVTWVIDAAVTSVVGADGAVQLIFTNSENTTVIIGRSFIIRLVVLESLVEASSTPPDPYDSWIASLTALAGETLTNANNAAASAAAALVSEGNAADSAADAAGSATDAEGYASSAEEIYDDFEAISATAELVEGDPTVEIIDGPDGKVFHFGIPKGQKGDKGDKGDNGMCTTVNNQIPDNYGNVMLKAAHIATDIVGAGLSTVKSAIETLIDSIADLVPNTRKVNNKALSADITLDASDVSAVPTTRKVNNKALSSDITLDASDVSAVPTTRKVNNKALSSDITLGGADIISGQLASENTVNQDLSSLNSQKIDKGVAELLETYLSCNGAILKEGNLTTIAFGFPTVALATQTRTSLGYLPQKYYPAFNFNQIYNCNSREMQIRILVTGEVTIEHQGGEPLPSDGKPAILTSISYINV